MRADQFCPKHGIELAQDYTGQHGAYAWPVSAHRGNVSESNDTSIGGPYCPCCRHGLLPSQVHERFSRIAPKQSEVAQ